jgi:DNA-binding CsgD family transcriptional regulator
MLSWRRSTRRPIGIECYLAAPLVRSNRLVGVMNVGRSGPRARFRQREIDVMKRLIGVLTAGETILAKPFLRQPAVQGAHLTGRERDVIDLMRVGLSNREIATHLTMSANTVRNHLASAYAKTGATNRLELVRFLEGNQAEGPIWKNRP